MEAVYEKLPHLHYESKIPLITCIDLNHVHRHENIQNVRKARTELDYLMFSEELTFLDNT